MADRLEMGPWFLSFEHGQLLPEGKILKSKLGTADAEGAKRPHKELNNKDERLTDHLHPPPAILRVAPVRRQPSGRQDGTAAIDHDHVMEHVAT